MEWRYLAQRIVTKAWLHTELPIVLDEIRFDRSGSGSLRGKVSPELGKYIAADGLPLFDKYGTLIYAEADGVLKWGGIVVSSKQAGGDWQIEASGISSYPTGVPYTGSYAKVQVDPLDVVRHIWSHVQNQPGWPSLDVEIDDTTSPVRLGEPAVPAYSEAFVGGQWILKSSAPPGSIDPAVASALTSGMTKTATTASVVSGAVYSGIPLPFEVTVSREKMTVTARSGNTLTVTRGVGGTTAEPHGKNTNAIYAGTPIRTYPVIPAKPYELRYWEAPDCGREIDKLRAQTPFDYVEEHSWIGTTDQVSHKIVLGYPQLGVRREDLVFMEGENITKVVELPQDGDSYANVIVGLGRGEGPNALRVTEALDEPDGRLRRPYVFTGKGIDSTAALTKFVHTELVNRSSIETIVESIEVTDHPNAPLGSWNLGDEILVQVDSPWLGEIEVWRRIQSWTLTSTTTATITLGASYVPSNQLAYELLDQETRIATLERSDQLPYSSITTPITDPDGNPLYDPDGNPLYKTDPIGPSIGKGLTAYEDMLGMKDLSKFAADDIAAAQYLADQAQMTADSALANGGGGNHQIVQKVNGVWPARPSAQFVTWKGPMPHPTIGGTGAVDGADMRVVTP